MARFELRRTYAKYYEVIEEIDLDEIDDEVVAAINDEYPEASPDEGLYQGTDLVGWSLLPADFPAELMFNAWQQGLD